MEYINRFYWLIALCLIISTGANASVNPKPFVIPELKEWKGSDGTFVPTEATKIVYAANNPELERIARIFAQDYQTMFGRSLEVVQGKGAAGDFIFSLRADKKLGKEGYTIRVTDRIALSAPENIGVYLGYTYLTSDCRTVRKSSAPERNPERLPRLSASRLYDRLRP